MERALLVGFSLVVVLAAVAVGPLGVGGAQPAVEERAAVSLVSAPTEGITLERGRFGTQRYHVEAPPAVVSVSDVAGTPTLRYVIDIPQAWLTVTSRYDLAGREGRLHLGASPETVSPHRVDQGRYDATVAIWLRTGTRERAILQRQVTVEVVR
jgi:hypothetical protein